MINVIQKSVILSFFERLTWSIKAFNATKFGTLVKLSNGVMIDLDKKKVIIPSDFELHVEGNLTLSSNKHVMIKSGQTEEERPGYLYSIWLNSDLDEYGLPIIKDQNLIDGESHGCS